MKKLGMLFYDDEDLEESFYWFEKSADHGDAMAMFKLGKYYKKGKGKDVVKVFEFFKKSAECKYMTIVDAPIIRQLTSPVSTSAVILPVLSLVQPTTKPCSVGRFFLFQIIYGKIKLLDIYLSDLI